MELCLRRRREEGCLLRPHRSNKAVTGARCPTIPNGFRPSGAASKTWGRTYPRSWVSESFLWGVTGRLPSSSDRRSKCPSKTTARNPADTRVEELEPFWRYATISIAGGRSDVADGGGGCGVINEMLRLGDCAETVHGRKGTVLRTARYSDRIHLDANNPNCQPTAPLFFSP